MKLPLNMKKRSSWSPSKPAFFCVWPRLTKEGAKQPKLSKIIAKALELDESNARAHYGLASLFVQQKKTQLAIEEFRRAIAARQDYAEAHYNLGILYFRTGKLNEAEINLARATELKPKKATFWVALGKVQWKRSKKDKAARSYRRALELDNNNMEAHFSSGSVLF